MEDAREYTVRFRERSDEFKKAGSTEEALLLERGLSAYEELKDIFSKFQEVEIVHTLLLQVETKGYLIIPIKKKELKEKRKIEQHFASLVTSIESKLRHRGLLDFTGKKGTD